MANIRTIVDPRRTLLLTLPRGGVGVEIGVHEGQFSRLIIQIAQPRKLYLIDPWHYAGDAHHEDSLYGGTDVSQKTLDERYERVCNAFSQQIKEERVTIIREKSRNALDFIAEPKLDFVYVDGDHSFDEVSFDLNHYFLRLRKGGILIADDYRVAGWWGDDVVRACHQLIGVANLYIECKIGSQIAFRKVGDLELTNFSL